MNYPRRFLFHANASGVSAHIRRPDDRILPVHAASVLPVTGGISEAKSGPHSIGEHVRYLFAETSAHGDYVDRKAAVAMTRKEIAPDALATETRVHSRVRGLHVGKRFEAQLAQMGMISRHPGGRGKPSIQLEGCKLEGIFVDGHALKFTLEEHLFNRCDTLDKLHAAHADGLPDEHAQLFHRPDEASAKALFVSDGLAYATVVSKMEWTHGKPEGLTDLGVNAFHLQGFGSVYFGELLIGAKSRRMTMIRFQLGSDAGGDASAATGEANGTPWPD